LKTFQTKGRKSAEPSAKTHSYKPAPAHILIYTHQQKEKRNAQYDTAKYICGEGSQRKHTATTYDVLAYPKDKLGVITNNLK